GRRLPRTRPPAPRRAPPRHRDRVARPRPPARAPRQEGRVRHRRPLPREGASPVGRRDQRRALRARAHGQAPRARRGAGRPRRRAGRDAVMKKRALLPLRDLTAGEIHAVLGRAAALKEARAAGQRTHTLPGKILGMIFEKPSTRTRVSFEVGMVELGGHAVYLAPEGSQIGRGEPVADTARVLSSYCHGIVIRTFAHARLEELARYSTVPVINGLTDASHPCQVLADLFTTLELLGDLRSVRFAWIGDGNNMANAWIDAAGILGLTLTVACPE